MNGFKTTQANKVLKELCLDNRYIFDRSIQKNAFYLNYKNYKNEEIKYRIKINE